MITVFYVNDDGDGVDDCNAKDDSIDDYIQVLCLMMVILMKLLYSRHHSDIH